MQASELQKRVVFGIIAAVVAGFAIYYGGSVFYLLVLIASAVASLEFDKMRGDGQISFIFCALPILLSYHPKFAALLIAVAIILVMVQQFMAKKYYSWLLITILYITIPAISLLWLRNQEHGLEAVIWLALVVVASDIGGYFFGRALGKNLLAPSISPKKTWEGFAGGVFCAVIASFIMVQEPKMILIAIVISAIGQTSDLMESAIKRNFNVKDTSTILPGHGGIMDRTDGFVLTAPIVALFYQGGVIAW